MRKNRQKGYFSWRAASLFVVAVVALIAFFLLALQRYQERLVDIVIASQQAELAEVSERLTAELRARSADLELLANIPELVIYSHSGHFLDDADSRREVEAYFARFLNAYPEYDQLRLIDAAGREQINLQRRDGVVVVTPDYQLQDKSRRYYVQEALAVGNQGVYLSRFDLNREFGAVQEPIKPTVRMVKAIVASGDGDSPSARALVVANLSIAPLLERFRSALVNLWQSEIFLIDENGYFVLHPDPELEWGYDRGTTGNRMERYFPTAWAALKAGGGVVAVDSFDGQSLALRRHLEGGHFISYPVELPGLASRATAAAGTQAESPHRYLAMMFIADEMLAPWALRNHWVWWALLGFIVTLLVAALYGWYVANQQRELAAQLQASSARGAESYRQLSEDNQRFSKRIATLRQLLRELRNSAAAVVGFASLLAQHADAEGDGGYRDELKLVDRSAKDLLATLDETQRVVADDESLD